MGMPHCKQHIKFSQTVMCNSDVSVHYHQSDIILSSLHANWYILKNNKQYLLFKNIYGFRLLLVCNSTIPKSEDKQLQCTKVVG